MSCEHSTIKSKGQRNAFLTGISSFLLSFEPELILLDIIPSLLPSPRAIETLLSELPSLGVRVDERLFAYFTARVRNYVEAMSAKSSLSPLYTTAPSQSQLMKEQQICLKEQRTKCALSFHPEKSSFSASGLSASL